MQATLERARTSALDVGNSTPTIKCILDMYDTLELVVLEVSPDSEVIVGRLQICREPVVLGRGSTAGRCSHGEEVGSNRAVPDM